MLEKNQRTKSMLSGLLDVVLLFVSFLLANYVRFNYVVFFEPGGAGPALQVARATLLPGQAPLSCWCWPTG